jgi:hypothetical protein
MNDSRYQPIEAPAMRPTIEAPHTLDAPIICASCLDTLAPHGACMNVGACETADRTATRYARRSTLKAPMAVTIMGNID